MNVDQIVRRVLESLDSTQIPYVLVGSFASNVYGAIRSTVDADVVVQMAPSQLADFMVALGPEFMRDPQTQFETVTGTSKTWICENTTRFVIELFELSSDPHDQERFRRRKSLPLFDYHAWVLTCEDVLVTKLRWLNLANRSKDRSDILGVLAVQRDAIDWPYVEKWCDAHGSRLLLEKLRAEVRGQLG